MIYLGTATNSYAYYIKALFISKLHTIIFFTVMQNIGILGTFWEHFGNKSVSWCIFQWRRNRRYVQIVFKTSLSNVRKANGRLFGK